MGKSKLLFFSLLLDAIGMLSIIFPGFGELSDLIWAPVSAYILRKMYPNKKILPAVFIAFTEEILPFSDFIPTFTLTWMYIHFFKRKKE